MTAAEALTGTGQTTWGWIHAHRFPVRQEIRKLTVLSLTLPLHAGDSWVMSQNILSTRIWGFVWQEIKIFNFLCLFFIYFLIMGKLLYSVVLGFCRTTTGIGHNYVYNPSLLSAPPPSTPLGRQCQAGLPVLQSGFPLAICLTHDSVQ